MHRQSTLSYVTRALALAVVALGLTAAILYQARLLASSYELNRVTFQGLQAIRNIPDAALAKAWAPRILSIVSAEKTVTICRGLPNMLAKIGGAKDDDMQGIAIWVALWFGLICVVYILAFRDRAVFYMFGTYACISFGYMPGIDMRVFPWDMPAVFFFALFIALLLSRPMRRSTILLLMCVIWIAIPFKETSIVLSIFPMFACRSMSLPARVRLTVLTAAVAMTMKVWLNLMCNDSPGSMTMQSFNHDGLLIAWNLRSLSHGHLFLINAGTLLAFIMLPPWEGLGLMFKAVAALFILSNFVFGVASEYRIWFEIIPLALYSLDCSLLRTRRPVFDGHLHADG